MNETQWKGNPKVFKSYLHWKPDQDNPKSGKSVNDSSFEEAAKHSCFGAVLNDDFIDISFDTEELSDIFWKMAEGNNWNCLILENTGNRHIHSFWKKPESWKQSDGKDKTLAVGLIADIHSGKTRIILRVNGNDRFPPSFEPDEIQEVPFELFPVDSDISLYDLGEGDGRNQALFRSILVLQSQVSSDVETIRRILTNTNNYLFREPLSDDELQTVLREGAFQKPVFFKRNAFLHDVFGDFLIRKYHLFSTNADQKKLLMYQDGTYTESRKAIERAMIQEIHSLKDSQRRETMKYLEIAAPFKALAESNFIAFRNGIFDLKEDKLLPFDPEIRIPCKILWDYNPNAYDETCDNFLNRITCNDPEIRKTVEESIGYSFFRSCDLNSAFFLLGKGKNGKTTFLKVLIALLGEQNVSTMDLGKLSDNRFATANLFGKLANIGDDISDKAISDSSLFKKVTSGSRIDAERKGENQFEFNPTASLFFSVNSMPKIHDPQGAALSRIVPIPFEARFTEESPVYDPFIVKKLVFQPSMEYLIKIGIEGLKRAIANNGFTKGKKSRGTLKEYELENDPVKGFVNYWNETDEDYLTREAIKVIFTAFKLYCTENGYREEITQRAFGLRMRTLGYESEPATKDGKSIRVYRKLQDYQ